MKKISVTTLPWVVLLVVVSMGLAAGDAEKGKALFNDPKLSAGTSGQSCNTCHPGGKGLEGVGAKKEWSTPGGKHKTLEDAVNICISMALKGKPLDVKSEKMQNLIAYLKSLKGAPGKTKKKSVEGC